MTEEEIRKLLRAIRDLALLPYPLPEGAIVRPAYALALGKIAGTAFKALEEK